MTRATTAPAYDLTLEVPLNRARLSPLITQVDVSRTITSSAIIASGRGATATRLAQGVQLNVAQGRVVETATVVVPVPLPITGSFFR